MSETHQFLIDLYQNNIKLLILKILMRTYKMDILETKKGQL